MVSEDDSRQRAFAITQRLAAFVRQHDIGSTDRAMYERTDGFVAPVQDWMSLPEAEEIYTADVTFAVEQFTRSLNICRHWRMSFPIVVTTRGPLPVDIASLFGIANPLMFAPYELQTANYLTQVLTLTFAQPPFAGQSIQYIPVDAAGNSFGEHLNAFLFARFQARESNISQKPGRLFTVTTNSGGLRVHYSPAYFFSPNNVFGSPTTPVKAWIQPGIYIFGAIGPGVPLTFDTQSHYQIPPLGNAHLNM